MLGDLRIFKRKENLVEKIRIQHAPDKQDSSKKKCVTMKKLSKPFHNTCS